MTVTHPLAALTDPKPPSDDGPPVARRGLPLTRDLRQRLAQIVKGYPNTAAACKGLKVTPIVLIRAIAGLPLYRRTYLRLLKAIDPARGKRIEAATVGDGPTASKRAK